MRLFFVLILATLFTGCSLFGSYTWAHPEKNKLAQDTDKAECLALASIFLGSNEDLLSFAGADQQKPNKGIETDCLAKKGYKRVSANTSV